MRRLLVRLFGVIAILAVNLLLVLLVGLMVMQVLAVGVNSAAGDALILCVLGVLSGVAVVIAHELGHLFIGLAVGLPFARLTLGMLVVVREEHRLRVRLNTKWFQPAAYVSMSKPDAQVWRIAAMIAAGPAMNLLIAALCLAIGTAIHPGPPSFVHAAQPLGWRAVGLPMPGNMATAWFNLAGLLSLWLGFSTLIPGRAAGLRTDGGQLLDLWRGKSS